MIIGTDMWSRLLGGLAAATGPAEQLTVAAVFLANQEQVVKAGLRANERDVVDSVSGETAEVRELLSGALLLREDAEASEFLVRLVASLDRSHARGVDVGNEGRTSEPEDHWGPYATGGAGPAYLLRWPRAARLPVDRQSLLSLAMPNHRVLSSGHGGIRWQLGAISESPARRAIIGSLLGRDAWPLRLAIWPGMDAAGNDFHEVGNCAVVNPDSVKSAAIENDVFEAIDFSADAKAHVLLLPELYVPRASVQAVSERLAEMGDSAPAMTVMGMSHRQDGDKWVNEAVVLDYSGAELWRHQKLSPFVTEDGLGECLSTGTEMRLRSSPVGWIATLICLDLFASPSRSALLAAAPSLVLVPSLSSKTSAHRNVLEEARAYGVACVVANQPLDVDRAAAPSLHTLRGSVSAAPDPIVVSWTPHP